MSGRVPLRFDARLPLLVSTFAFVAGACGGGSNVPELGEKRQELHVTCPGTTTVQGIDVTRYQGAIDWAEVRSAGKAFAFIRASQGCDGADPTFSSNWSAAHAAGVLRGAVHSFHASEDAAEQAEFFVSQITLAGGLGEDDLPPALAIETMDGSPASVLAAGARNWLGLVETALGRRPVVLTGGTEGESLGSDLASYPLWVASYRADCPAIPDAWPDWAFWQYSATGACPGISGLVSLSLFNGSAGELSRFIVESVSAHDGGTPDVDGGFVAELDAGGVPMDAGVSSDASQWADGGEAGDANEGLDAAQLYDGGPDPFDGGIAAGDASNGDATDDDPVDAAFSPDGEPQQAGCGCGNSGPTSGTMLLLVLAILQRSQRRVRPAVKAAA